MLVYIVKSTACLAIFFLFYMMFLEKENMHIFKRFYLLGALVLSLIIPALVFTEYVEATPVSEPSYVVEQGAENSKEVINIPPALESDVTDIAPLLWMVYFLGLFFFGMKFLRNLFQIFRRVRRNPKYRKASFIQVLLQEKIPPHTFFSYIFLNKTKLESNQIPKEVLLHEETHARQKHSWDVVFVELLHVIFWINPFVYLLKKAIKLNHEFLADQAVLKKDVDKITYQNTLLSYLSPDSEKKYQPLANAINYSSIKKRFTVMKTHTSKKSMFLRYLLLLPTLLILVYGFSERNTVALSQNNDERTVINDINIEILSDGNLILNNENVLLDNIAKKVKELNVGLEPYFIKNYVSANILYDENQLELIEKVQVELQYVGISNIEHISKRTSSVLGIEGFKPSSYNGKTVNGAKVIRREKVLEQMNNTDIDNALLEIVWIEIKKENQIWLNGQPIDLRDISSKLLEKDDNKLEIQIYSAGVLHQNFLNRITKEIEKVGVPRIKVFSDQYIVPESNYQDEIEIAPETVILKTNKITLKNSSLQEGASRKLMAEYNTLAKKYNTMISESNHIQIKMKDVKRLEYIYGLMSNKQKADAEPFPDFPEPPPPPKEPKAPKVKKGMKSDIPPVPPVSPAPDLEEIEEVIELEEAKMREQETLLEEQEILLEKEEAMLEQQEILLEQQEEKMHEQEVRIKEQNAKLKEIEEETERVYRIKQGLESSIPEPPSPPDPLEPLDYVISMAKKDAVFHLEGKEISSDEAIEAMKKNKSLNIDSSRKNGEKPLVKLSTEPFVWEK